ncbi:hypothetical protein AAC03nite_23960 [Alicyclobacillus acidoterrestris]|uniref:2Fe-2S iron-sulfur cluster-binding protein n=1 Tax=Alicyclobacillus suci TaxID=2816080 RepID=UPI001197BDF9|nr:2Fe-2S iron-sulfur cluster-binding protein [Alicyclobacillus suci]GEO26611.1 hypothetical protein AAC03nite_23960 [Alicyclobacillus acidoterrestris]
MPEITMYIVQGSPDSGPVEQEYQVPYRDGMSLLDALLWIRENRDPTLSVRYSCRSANACKECSASIDGKVGYLCNTKAHAGAQVHVRPIPGRQWIKDLVTELD